MSEIPENAKAKAEAFKNIFMQADGAYDIYDIALWAIMEERERCARIIEDHPRFIALNSEDAEIFGAFAREAGPSDYAQSIRRGDT